MSFSSLRGLHLSTRRVVAGVVVLVTAAVIFWVASNAAGKQATEPPLAKNFSLAELGGRPGSTVSLAAYRGHPVIINFFASWCPPCKRETPMLARFYLASKGRIVMIGVDANDESGPALHFLHAAGVRYPVAFDPFPASTTTSYGVLGLPQTFFLNAQHRIVKHVVGQMTMKQLTAGVARMEANSRQDRG